MQFILRTTARFKQARPGATSRILAIGLWVFGLVFWAGTLVYLLDVSAYINLATAVTSYFILEALGYLALHGLATVGLIIILRSANPRFGWLMLASGFIFNLNGFTENYSFYALLIAPETNLPFALLAAWIQNFWVVNLSLLFVYVPLLFPDGRLPSPRWRPVFWFITLFLGVTTLAFAFLDAPLTNIFLEGETPVRNPLGVIPTDFIPLPLAEALIGLFALLFLASMLAAIGSLVFRWRGGSGEVRQQIKWLLYMLGLLVALRAAEWILFTLFSPLTGGFEHEYLPYFRYAQLFALIGVEAALGFAVFKYRLYDIDLIVNRTLVYGALTAVVAGGYVLIVTALGAILPAEVDLLPSLLATGILAALFAPLRERLQRGVNRLMFGERDDPYLVLSRLGRLLSSSAAPAATLHTLVETIATALRLPYTAVALEQDGAYKIRAEYGTAVTGEITLPLVHQNEVVGRLVVAARAPGEPLSPKDTQLLEDIAHQAAAVAHAVRLTAALQRSRQRLVMAREEERRRLRRDLHDGLGPTLASHTLKLDMAMDLIRDEPEAAVAQLQDLYKQTQEIVADIRRLVHNLRPPALDDLGLVGAVQANIQHSQRAGGGPQISVEAPINGLPLLSAAVELAAYRIVMEAVTNVIRHARAGHCHVRFSLANGLHHKVLQIHVDDDGQGLPDSLHQGVGLASMRERAEELGGRMIIEAGEGGGTWVCAELPLPEESAP